MRTWTVVRGYCAVVALFLAIRGLTTLALGASFHTPGTGWRSVWQLAMVAILMAGWLRPSLARAAAGITAIVYAAATLLELHDARVLLGVVPVDMRDRLVHPLIAVIGIVCILVTSRHGAVRRTVSTQARPHA